MEKIMSILGLRIHNECIMDRFTWSLARACERIANKFVNNPESTRAEEEIVPLSRRRRIVDDEEDKAYQKALRLLAKIRPEYKKYLPKRGKGNKIPDLFDLLKKKIRLAVWVGTGNEIPFRELSTVLLKNLLKEKGYAYRRNKLRWYRDNLCVGKDLFDASKHLESIEAVDRRLLTISF